MAEAGQRFSGARFADDAEDFAAGDIERNPIEGDERALARCKLHREVADAEQRRVHRSLGLSAPRSQSPSMFTATTKTARVRPGKATIHHSPEKR